MRHRIDDGDTNNFRVNTSKRCLNNKLSILRDVHCEICHHHKAFEHVASQSKIFGRRRCTRCGTIMEA
jgi:hypothetical protein